MSRQHFRLPPWPDLRGWAIVGFFAITFYCLRMIEVNPALLANPGFMQFISALSTGGILLIASNLFGGTKSSADANAKLAEIAASGTTPGTATMTATLEATTEAKG